MPSPMPPPVACSIPQFAAETLPVYSENAWASSTCNSLAEIPDCAFGSAIAAPVPRRSYRRDTLWPIDDPDTDVALLLAAAAPALARDDEAWTLEAPDLAANMRKQPEPRPRPQTIEQAPARNFGDARCPGGGPSAAVWPTTSPTRPISTSSSTTRTFSSGTSSSPSSSAAGTSTTRPRCLRHQPRDDFRWHFLQRGPPDRLRRSRHRLLPRQRQRPRRRHHLQLHAPPAAASTSPHR